MPIIDSTNVDPDLGSPTIKISLKYLNSCHIRWLLSRSNACPRCSIDVQTMVLTLKYDNTVYSVLCEVYNVDFDIMILNILISNKRDPILNFFLSGIFFAFAMLAKIQIIFLALYIFYLIPYINKREKYEINNLYLKRYLFP